MLVSWHPVWFATIQKCCVTLQQHDEEEASQALQRDTNVVHVRLSSADPAFSDSVVCWHQKTACWALTGSAALLEISEMPPNWWWVGSVSRDCKLMSNCLLFSVGAIAWSVSSQHCLRIAEATVLTQLLSFSSCQTVHLTHLASTPLFLTLQCKCRSTNSVWIFITIFDGHQLLKQDLLFFMLKNALFFQFYYGCYWLLLSYKSTTFTSRLFCSLNNSSICHFTSLWF